MLATGLAEAGAVLMAALAFGAGVPAWLAWLLVAAVAVRAVAWMRYCAALARDDAPAAAIASMGRVHPWLLAAVCALLAGWWFKFALVTRASQLQGYAFGKLRKGHPLAGARAGSS